MRRILTGVFVGHLRRVKLKDASGFATFLALLLIAIDVRLILVKSLPEMQHVADGVQRVDAADTA